MSPTIAFASLPGAREILREFDTASSRPLIHLVRGRCGTGKSTLLAAIRDRLHARGIASRADVPPDDGPDIGRDAAPAALIIDDAHTLEPAALERLRAVVESGNRTIVVATRPRPHDLGLRALAETVSRRGRVLELRALGSADIAPFARELGMTVPRSVTQHIHRQTGGIHGGVVTALTAACAARLDAGIAAVDAAVTNWARALLDRTEPDLLEVLVVAATGAGLDPGELTEVLGVDHATAWDLIDRARAGALVTDADLLPAPAVAPLRTLVGDRRYLTVQRRLLEARLDAGLLRDHTALLLAESGVREPRLAEYLCAAAEKTDDAVRYYTAAVAAGADPQAVAVRWAEAAAQAGDGDTALRLAEPVLGRTDVSDADLAAAVRICAGVWTRRGLVQRAAQLYSWLGAHRVGADWAVGATVQYLAGEVEAAAALSATADRWPPTDATARAALIVAALGRSVGATDPSADTAHPSTTAVTTAADGATDPFPIEQTTPLVHGTSPSPINGTTAAAPTYLPTTGATTPPIPATGLTYLPSVGEPTSVSSTGPTHLPTVGESTSVPSTTYLPAIDESTSVPPSTGPTHLPRIGAAVSMPSTSATYLPAIDETTSVPSTGLTHLPGIGAAASVPSTGATYLPAIDSTAAAAPQTIAAAHGGNAVTSSPNGTGTSTTTSGPTDATPRGGLAGSVTSTGTITSTTTSGSVYAAPRGGPAGSSTPNGTITEATTPGSASAMGVDPALGESRSTVTPAASALIQAARAEVAPGGASNRFLPCTAASIATLLCLSMGEPRRAADALRGGSEQDPQLLVLTAWTAMLGGDEQGAADIVTALDLAALQARDRLLAHGVTVGLARRSGDHAALTRAWEAARPLFDDVTADLLALLPIGELWLAAIRLRDEGRVATLVDAAAELLQRLGYPPAWANAFHWYAIQASIARERPDELVPPAQRLKAAAQAGDIHAAVLADAGRTWVLALRGEVDHDGVAAAVRRLAGIGMIWDAGRLASDAALAAPDPAVATALLKLARTVRAEARPQQRAARSEAAMPPPTAPAPAPGTILSEREREVAELVLLGLTYREIGARLYISAKTVEHHVARIRRRIGAGSRSELLSMLRAMGHGSLLV